MLVVGEEPVGQIETAFVVRERAPRVAHYERPLMHLAIGVVEFNEVIIAHDGHGMRPSGGQLGEQ